MIRDTRLPRFGGRLMRWVTQRPLRVVVVFGALALLIMASHWGRTVADSRYYWEVSEYFRGHFARARLRTPFAYRIVLPYFFASLPTGIRMTWATFNWLCVTAAGVGIYFVCLREGIGRVPALAAGGFLIVSVPAFAYGPALLTEPASMLLRLTLLACVRWRRLAPILPLGLLATFVREDNILFAVVALVWCVFGTGDRVQGLLWASVAVGGIAFALIVRASFHDLPSYTWAPSVNQAVENLKALSNWTSVLTALGVVFPLFFFGLVERDRVRALIGRGAFRFWTFFSLGLFCTPVLAFLVARMDGRPYWAMYPALLPIVGATLAVNGSCDRYQRKPS